MKIKIIDFNSGNTQATSDTNVILERDSWNDYNYYTYYNLHIKHSNGGFRLIGGVRILKFGQKEDEKFLLNLGILTALPENFCSLGNTLDYYSRISELNQELKLELLTALNDIIHKPKLKKKFKNERGFKEALLRPFNSGLEDDFFTLAPIILSKEFDNLPELNNFKFSFYPSPTENPLLFDFSSKQLSNQLYENILPNRIFVIVGRNGSGKSTLLSKIARVAFSSTNDRKYLKEVGSLEPSGLGFPRIINISHSAFDSFKIPGIRLKEIKRIVEDIDNNEGRYIYCGIRDISKEFDSEIQNIESDENGILNAEFLNIDKFHNNYLKSIAQINDEILRAFSKINDSEHKLKILKHSFGILSEEPSLRFLKDLLQKENLNNELKLFLNNLSTGHTFVVHSITKMIYHIEKRSLVLFDEPESHLHPPLLAVLMKTIRYIMEEQNAFIIIATHSPVVVQETLKKNILVIKRVGSSSNSTNPNFQTYGDTIGNITSNVFYLNSGYTDFHNDLDIICKRYIGAPENFENYINEIFDNDISMQAYAYLISKYKSMLN